MISVLTLLPISEFVLDEKFQQNASTYAIFYVYESPKLIFPFFILCNFIFLPNECPDNISNNIKLHEMKNGKSNLGFSYI